MRTVTKHFVTLGYTVVSEAHYNHVDYQIFSLGYHAPMDIYLLTGRTHAGNKAPQRPRPRWEGSVSADGSSKWKFGKDGAQQRYKGRNELESAIPIKAACWDYTRELLPTFNPR